MRDAKSEQMDVVTVTLIACRLYDICMTALEKTCPAAKT